MASKKHWKKYAKKIEELRGIDQARHFEERSKLEGQLRAVDHILTDASLPGPTTDEWMSQAQSLLLRLVTCRREKREDGFTAADLEEQRPPWSFPYFEHFTPVQRIDPTPLMSEHYQHGDPSAT